MSYLTPLPLGQSNSMQAPPPPYTPIDTPKPPSYRPTSSARFTSQQNGEPAMPYMAPSSRRPDMLQMSAMPQMPAMRAMPAMRNPPEMLFRPAREPFAANMPQRNQADGNEVLKLGAFIYAFLAIAEGASILPTLVIAFFAYHIIKTISSLM